MDREPSEFEAFAAKLMTTYGFRKMKVTNVHTAPDGGIDGNGESQARSCNDEGGFPMQEVAKLGGATRDRQISWCDPGTVRAWVLLHHINFLR